MQKLSAVENMGVGVVSGAIEVIILQPMLYCKNATQQGLKLSLDPRVLYRGIGMSVTNMSILTGLQFPLTGMVANVMTGGANRQMSGSEQIGAGFLGGAISGLACAPMELSMIQQQRFGGSLLGTPMRIVSEFGLLTLMRGLVTSCGREGLFTAGVLGIAPVFANTLKEDYGFNELAKPCGAVGAGVVAATLSHPLDTIKTCMQGDIERKQYGTLTETAKTLLKEGGPQRFFSGWHWRTGRMICAVYLLSSCKDIFAPIMFPHHFKDADL
jgi:hypothetical protein